MKARDLKTKLNKGFPGMIYTGSEIKDIVTPRLPSGSFAFDLVTGGGIPRNRITIFHGPKSSGKTTHSLRMIGQHQVLHPSKEILFIDFEHTFDWDWAQHFIVDIDKVHVVQPDYAELGVQVMKNYLNDCDDLGLIVIDSLGGMINAAEIDAGAADFVQLGLQVKLINRMLKYGIVAISRIRRAGGELSIIAINQIRANMNASKWGRRDSQPGGKYLEHMASMDIRFYEKEVKKAGGVSIQSVQSFIVDKNKVGIPKRSGEHIFYLTAHKGHTPGELVEEKIVTTYAKRTGLLSREGNKWRVNIKSKKFPKGRVVPTLVALSAMLRKDRALFTVLKKKTLLSCTKNPVLTADEDTE